MNDSFSTHYVKGGFASVDEIVLEEKAATRVVFRPSVHPGGVRGHIVRQKIGTNGTWLDVNDANFVKMPPDSGVSIELNTEATGILYEKLGQLYQVQSKGVGLGDQDYVVAKKDEAVVINDRTRAQAIRQLLDRGYSQEFWRALTTKDPALASKLAGAKIQHDREAAITEFRAALTSHRDNEDFWQRFFETHPWMLQAAFSTPVVVLNGETYLGGKKARGRNGKGGVATDFLLADESTSSFTVVEIKTPSAPLVGGRYRGKDDADDLANEVYSIHCLLSGALVQVRNQVTVAVEHFQNVLGDTFDEVNRLHPKAALVAGISRSLTDRQKASFDQFRNALHSTTVITFDELLRRLEIMYLKSRESGADNTNERA